MFKREDQEMLSECYSIILEGGPGSGGGPTGRWKDHVRVYPSKEEKNTGVGRGRKPGTPGKPGITKVLLSALQQPGGVPIDTWNELATKYVAKIKRSRYATTWQPKSKRQDPPVQAGLLNATEDFTSKEMLDKMGTALGLELQIDQTTGNVIGITDEPQIASISNKLADNLISELGQHFPAGANASLKRACGMLVRHLVQRARGGEYKYDHYTRA